MNAPPPARGGWSRGTWWAVVAAVLAMQVFLIFLLSAKAPPRAASAGASNALRLVTPQPAARDSLAQFGVSDPAQSALVSPQGYSGPTWLQIGRAHV